ncbi:hypothetical protein Pmani_005824 [Petrolisthes manimaculis]|uniref:Uncharacterized protein n=1 Tax=Petrolisthes manimaculis TaxID=1843537 RepID=A0AAE1QD14_9EUCA|nr:hypothetical protein Pmani_005824 [Petrolisthes manimaculis]
MINRRLKTTQTTLTEDHTSSWLLRTRLSVEGKCTSSDLFASVSRQYSCHVTSQPISSYHVTSQPISSCHVTKPSSRSC